MFITSGNELKVWELRENQFTLVNDFNFGKPISSFSIKSDNNHVALLINRDLLTLFDPNTQQLTHQVTQLNSKCCAFDSSGKYLAIGNYDGSIDILDYKSSSVKRTNHKVLDCPINCISWSKNDRFIACGGQNGAISLFNNINMTLSQKQLLLSTSSKTLVSCLCIHSSQQNLNLAAAYDDGHTVLWDTNKSMALCQFKNHTGPCTSVIVSPLNNLLMISGGLDGLINLYDLTHKSIIKSYNAASAVTSLDLSINGYTCVVGTINGQIQLIDLRHDSNKHALKAHDCQVYATRFLNCTATPIRRSESNQDTTLTTIPTTSLLTCNKSTSAMNLHQHTTYSNIFSPEIHGTSQTVSSFVLHKSSEQQVSTPIMANAKVSSVLPNKMRASGLGAASSRQYQIFSPSPLVDRVSSKTEIHSSPLQQQQQQQQQQMQVDVIAHNQQSPSDSSSSVQLSNASSSSMSDTNDPTHEQNPQNLIANSTRTDTTLNNHIQMHTGGATSLANSIQLERINDKIDDLRDLLLNEFIQMKSELYREVDELKLKVCSLSVNEALIDEINRLKEENKRLRKQF